jgi:hypothetical protein
MTERPPQRPCHAYREVERALPPGFLVANVPPTTGRKLIVTSQRDSVTSYWEMDPMTAHFVFEELQHSGAEVNITSANYDNR